MLIMLSLLISTAFANCDQHQYDRVYKAIIQQALSAKNLRKAIKEKHSTIDNLRILCKGQRSSYEYH